MSTAKARREENAVRKAVRKVLSNALLKTVDHPIPPDWAGDIIVQLIREPGEWAAHIYGGQSHSTYEETTELVCAVLEDKVLLRAVRTACSIGTPNPYYKLGGPLDALKRIGHKALDQWIRDKCHKLQLQLPPKVLLKNVEFVWGTKAAVLESRSNTYIATVYGYWTLPSYWGYYPSMHSSGDVINKLAKEIGVTPIVAKRILCAQISREEFEAEMAITKLGR